MHKLWNSTTQQYEDFNIRVVISPEPPVQVDIGDLCTHCGRNTANGFGLFDGRIGSDADAELILQDQNIRVTTKGYMCTDCQSIQCDQCDKATIDYNIVDGGIICQECLSS